jgi:hypothetical protein
MDYIHLMKYVSYQHMYLWTIVIHLINTIIKSL